MNQDSQATNRIYDFFQNDHREIDELLTKLKNELIQVKDASSPPLESLLKLFSDFDRRLERHIGWEEEILFPEVETAQPELKQGPGAVMRSEHVDIRSRKAAAFKLLGEGEMEAAFGQLNAMIEILVGHNQKEEQIYYPTSDRLLSQEKANEVLRRVQEKT